MYRPPGPAWPQLRKDGEVRSFSRAEALSLDPAKRGGGASQRRAIVGCCTGAWSTFSLGSEVLSCGAVFSSSGLALIALIIDRPRSRSDRDVGWGLFAVIVCHHPFRIGLEEANMAKQSRLTGLSRGTDHHDQSWPLPPRSPSS